jgi:membrane-associated phospholipid phosphatase
VYLGVHYPTDAIASLVWAIGACPLVLAVWNRFVMPRIRRAPVATLKG